METPDVTVGELLKLLGEKVVELYQYRQIVDGLKAENKLLIIELRRLNDGKLE